MKISTTMATRHPAALQLAVALVALVAVLAAGCSSDEGATTTQAAATTAVVTTTTAATTTVATTTTEAPTTTTTAAATTTAPAAKTPMATVDELVAAIYAAVNAKDSAALWALTADDALHPIYYVEGRTGTISDNIAPGYDLASSPMQGIEVLGAPVLSGDGDVVVVPAAYTFPDGVLTGFDVMVVRHVDGGLLVGGAATLYADDRPDLVADPAEAWALIEASGAAMNADDVEGALATMSGLVVFAEDMTDVETYIRGTSALREFFTNSLGLSVELTGEPVMSGPFVAVPAHLSTEAGFFSDGVFVFWISDGKIALQAWAQGY